MVLTPLTARLLSRIDARWVATISFVAFAVSYFMRSGYTADAGFWDFVMPLLVQGIAMGTFFVSMLAIAFEGLPPEQIPSASGISNFARITAGAFAASITTTFWDRREAFHQSRLSEMPNIFSPLMQQATDRLHAFGFTDLQSYELLARSLAGQAYLLAATDLFWISGWLSVLAIAFVWLARRSVGSNVSAGAD